MRFAIVLYVVYVVCALARDASAQPEVEFARELQAGIAALQAGNLMEARAALIRARTIDRKAGAPHRYLARVSRADKEWGDCIESAHEALRVDPKTETTEMRALHAACRASAKLPAFTGELGESSAVAITSNLPALVKLRGEPFGATPILPRPIPAGRLAFDIEKAGYLTAHVDLDALPGIVTDLKVELQIGAEPGAVQLARKTGVLVLPKRPTLLVVDGIAARTDDANRLPLSPGLHVIEIREPGKDPWQRRIAITAGLDLAITPDLVDAGPRENRRTLAFALGGAGALLCGVGVGMFYRSRNASDDAREILAAEIARPIGDTTEPLRTRDDFDDARSRAKRDATISNVAYVAGLGLVGAGIYFFITSRAPSDEDVPALVIAPVTGGAFIARTIRW